MDYFKSIVNSMSIGCISSGYSMVWILRRKDIVFCD